MWKLTRDFHPALSPSCAVEDSRIGSGGGGFQVCFECVCPRLHLISSSLGPRTRRSLVRSPSGRLAVWPNQWTNCTYKWLLGCLSGHVLPWPVVLHLHAQPSLLSRSNNNVIGLYEPYMEPCKEHNAAHWQACETPYSRQTQITVHMIVLAPWSRPSVKHETLVGSL